MNDKKSLPAYFAEWWDNRQMRKNDGHNWNRWLPTPGNILFTLLMIGLLILTQRAWANNSPNSVNAPGPSATTINYQGRLADSNGNPINGNRTIQFTIYDAANGGNVVWNTETHANVPVTDGLFNVGLGSLTSGGIPTTVWNGDRYLQITVNGEALSPRELIRSVPIAGMALTVPDGTITNVQTIERGPNAGLPQTSSNQFVDIPGYELTMHTTGGPVMLMFQGTIRRENADTTGGAFLNFTIDGVPVSSSASGLNQIVSAFTQQAEPATTIWIASPPPGMHTFRVQWRAGTGTTIALNQEHYTTQFAIIEFKK